MSEGYDRPRWDDEEDGAPASDHSLHGDELAPAALAADGANEADNAIERSSENVLESGPEPVADLLSSEDALPSEEEPEAELVELPADEPGIRPPEPRDEPAAVSAEHAPGELTVPPGYPVLE